MTGIYKVVDYQAQSHCPTYVPDLQGMHYKDAQQIAKVNGLKLVVIDSIPIKSELDQTILSQIPKPQSPLGEEYTIEVTLGMKEE